jgi:hypothetical protein
MTDPAFITTISRRNVRHMAMVSIACSRLSVSVTFTGNTVNRQAGFNCGMFQQQRYI